MSLVTQILPLVGVAIGAATSFLVSSLNERVRWRRQQAVRWNERRLGAYADYAHAVKGLANQYRRIAISRGLTTGSSPTVHRGGAERTPAEHREGDDGPVCLLATRARLAARSDARAGG